MSLPDVKTADSFILHFTRLSTTGKSMMLSGSGVIIAKRIEIPAYDRFQRCDHDTAFSWHITNSDENHGKQRLKISLTSNILHACCRTELKMQNTKWVCTVLTTILRIRIRVWASCKAEAFAHIACIMLLNIVILRRESMEWVCRRTLFILKVSSLGSCSLNALQLFRSGNRTRKHHWC